MIIWVKRILSPVGSEGLAVERQENQKSTAQRAVVVGKHMKDIYF